MLSDVDRSGLSDIVDNIALAESFVDGLDYDRFLNDMRTFYACPHPMSGNYLRSFSQAVA